MKEGIHKNLWSKLQNKITFGINESFQFISPTAITFVDWTFYRDRFDLIKDFPLVIGKHDGKIGYWYTDKQKGHYQKCPKSDSLIMIPAHSEYYGKESLKKGVYNGILAGMFTLTLAIALGFTEIFLLGFDMTDVNGLTHFYQNNDKGIGQFCDEDNTERTGVGYNNNGLFNTGVFNNDEKYIQQFWKPYLQEKDVKIYNVSMNSRINTFEKITYDSFFERIQNEKEVNKNSIREKIRNTIKNAQNNSI